MATQVQSLKCDWCEREETQYETLDEAIEAGWYLLRGPDGEWDYCTIDCLKAHL